MKHTEILTGSRTLKKSGGKSKINKNDRLTATPYRSLVSETGRLSTLFNHRACVPIPGGEHDPEQMSTKLTEMGI